VRKNIPTLSTFYLLKNLSALKKNLLPQLESLHESHGDIFGIKLNNLKCFIRKPEYIKHVLVDNHQNYEKGDGFLAFKPLIGNGLLTSDGDKWVKDRKILSPVFAT
jgi:cytochrome P450